MPVELLGKRTAPGSQIAKNGVIRFGQLERSLPEETLPRGGRFCAAHVQLPFPVRRHPVRRRQKREPIERILPVPDRTGRLEKRIHIEVPLQLLMLGNPGDIEKTRTQNVSAHGVRVLTRRPLQPQEHLVAATADGEVRMQARVVYCQRLPDGRFAVGLQFQEGYVNFQEGHVNWSGIPKGSAD